MSGIKELISFLGLDGINVRTEDAEKSKPHTRRVHRKNKKGKNRRQLNEVNLQDLARENLVTKDFNPRQPRNDKGRWTKLGGFSEEDEETYWNYSADGLSEDIGPMLRGHEMPYTDADDEEGIQGLRSVVDSMDRISDGYELNAPLSVFRVAPVGKLKVGDEVTDQAFQSTTEFGAVMERYRTNEDDTIMRIDLPKGFRALPHYEAYDNGAKGEVIIPRGTKLRAVREENGVMVMEPVGRIVAKRWHFDPNQRRDRRGRWTDGFGGGLGMDAPNARRLHRDDVSPFPASGAPRVARRATGARAAPAKKAAAKKTVTAPAKTSPAPRRVNNSLYDGSTGTVTSRGSIPRINRGGTHIQQHADGRPIVSRPYTDPGEAYYQRNAGPNRITNERLQEIFEDPSKMTLAEKRMVASAGGAKALDGTDPILVSTSRGPRELERYALIGQLRSKIAPGSGNSKSGITRGGLSEERRKKMAEKRRESGKPNAAEFGKIEKQITEDWSTDGGKTVACVFCGKSLSPHSMSVETPKPKSLGGNYKDRGGRWPAHATCNTKAGEAAQKDPIAYQEEMMKKFTKLPLETRKRLPHVYDYFPQLGAYPGTAAQRKKFMAGGPK